MGEVAAEPGRERIDVPGVRLVEVLFKQPDTQVLHTVLDPGQEIPWHYHSAVDDIFYIVKGPVRIYTNDGQDVVLLDQGELHRIAPGQTHRVCNESSHTIEFLLLQGIGSYDFLAIENQGK